MDAGDDAQGHEGLAQQPLAHRGAVERLGAAGQAGGELQFAAVPHELQPLLAAGRGILDDNGCPEVTILHCNTQYPTPYEDANLTAMLELFDQFGLPVGLSDHTPGWECDVAATVLGAQVIEKHFTLDKSWPGPDQKASLDPTEFKAMVQAVRHVEAALGDGHKHLTASEAPNKAIARKSIVAARPIKAGEVFTAENLLTKRPGDGISPMLWYTVLGQTAKRDFAEDEKIEL